MALIEALVAENQLKATYKLLILVLTSCDGRVVKALDSKSNGISPRRFKSYSQRTPQFFKKLSHHPNLLWNIATAEEGGGGIRA